MRDDDPPASAVPAVTTRHLCLACRLLQAATGQCVHCGASTIAPVELVRELLQYRDLSLAAERDLGMITGLVAAGTFVFPILWPVAVASLGALVVRVPMRHLRKRARLADPVAAIVIPPLQVPARATVLRGTIRRFRGETATSAWDQEPVIAEEIAINGDLGVLVRHAQAVPFLFEADSGERVVVRGPVRLTSSPGWTAGGRRVRPGDDWLIALGLPADLRVRGTARRVRVVDGTVAQLAVSPDGIGDEAIAEYAGLRDGGMTRVWRGVGAAPVLIVPAT